MHTYKKYYDVLYIKYYLHIYSIYIYISHKISKTPEYFILNFVWLFSIFYAVTVYVNSSIFPKKLIKHLTLAQFVILTKDRHCEIQWRLSRDRSSSFCTKISLGFDNETMDVARSFNDPRKSWSERSFVPQSKRGDDGAMVTVFLTVSRTSVAVVRVRVASRWYRANTHRW